jgi:DNA-binding transcriptional MocR family regulator
MFLWARHPRLPDPVALSNRAALHDIMLGPGHLFSATLQATAWMRFNVAFSTDPRLLAFLESELLPESGRQAAPAATTASTRPDS